MLEFSKLAICYEAIQRIYRNAVVDHARSALQRAYPDDWPQRVKRLYGNEWQQMEDEANVVDLNNFAEDKLVDALDCLGVNHFYVLFENLFGELFLLRANDVVKARVKKSVLAEQTRIQTLRNSIAHPSAADLRSGPAHARLTDACEILRRIDEASPAAAQIDALMKMLHDGPTPEKAARIKGAATKANHPHPHSHSHPRIHEGVTTEPNEIHEHQHSHAQAEAANTHLHEHTYKEGYVLSQVTKGAKKSGTKTERHREFFEDFLTRLNPKTREELGKGKIRQNYCTFSAGTMGAYAVEFMVKYGDKFIVELYISSGDKQRNKFVFDQLRTQGAHLEAELHQPLTWRRLDGKRDDEDDRDACRIYLERPGHVLNSTQADLKELQDWAAEKLLPFKKAFDPRVRQALDMWRRDHA